MQQFRGARFKEVGRLEEDVAACGDGGAFPGLEGGEGDIAGVLGGLDIGGLGVVEGLAGDGGDDGDFLGGGRRDGFAVDPDWDDVVAVGGGAVGSSHVGFLLKKSRKGECEVDEESFKEVKYRALI